MPFGLSATIRIGVGQTAAAVAPAMGSVLANQTAADALNAEALDPANYTAITGRTISSVVFEGSADGVTWDLDGSASLVAIATLHGRVRVTDTGGHQRVWNLGTTDPVPVVQSAPTITGDGTPAVGEAVTLGDGTFIGANTGTVTHELLRGAAVIATNPTSPYTVVAADAGTNLYYRATPALGDPSTSQGLTIPAASGPVSSTQEFDAIARRVATIPVAYASTTPTGNFTQPTRGRVEMNHDNSFSYIRTDDSDLTAGSDSFQVEINNGGAIENILCNITVAAHPVEKLPDGWETRYVRTYYPPIDWGNNRLAPYPGPGHRSLHIAPASAGGMTYAQIATESGANVNDNWINGQSTYGWTEAKPLEETTAYDFCRWLITDTSLSMDILFKSGEIYSETRSLWNTNFSGGMSPMHPIRIGRYGTGAWPHLASMNISRYARNVIIQEVEADSLPATNNRVSGNLADPKGEFIAVDGLYKDAHDEFDHQFLDAFLFRRFKTRNAHKLSLEGKPDWWSLDLRSHNGYTFGVFGGMFEQGMTGRAGWQPNYDYRGEDPSAQAPNIYSHSIYNDNENRGIFVRDVITCEGAFAGMHWRPGGVYSDIIYIENNIAGGTGRSSNAGYAALINCWVTSPALKSTEEVAQRVGGAWQLQSFQRYATAWQSGGTNFMDPDDPNEPVWANVQNHEFAPTGKADLVEICRDPTPGKNYARDATGSRLMEVFATSEDPGEFRWGYVKGVQALWCKGTDKVWDGDPATPSAMSGALSATLATRSVQRWLNDKLATTGSTVMDVINHLWSLEEPWAEIVSLQEWGLGAAGYTYDRSTPQTMYFKPFSGGDGVQVGDAFNWSGNRRPINGDTLHFGSHAGLRHRWPLVPGAVTFDGSTDFRLYAPFSPTSISGAAELVLMESGFLEMPAHSANDALTVRVQGGLFLNTGAMTGTASVTATAGETVLCAPGAPWTQAAGTTLRAEGSALNDAGAGIGADGGAGTASLSFAAGSTLHLVGDAGGMPQLRKFQSGRFANADPTCTFDVDCGGAALTIDVTGVPPNTYTIIAANNRTGTFATPTVIGGSATVGYTASGVTLNVT